MIFGVKGTFPVDQHRSSFQIDTLTNSDHFSLGSYFSLEGVFVRWYLRWSLSEIVHLNLLAPDK